MSYTKYLQHEHPHHPRFNELQKSMFQQADPPTSLVAWDQRSAFSGGSVRVVRFLLRPTEVYQSYSHQSMIFVSVAQVTESLLQRNLCTISQNSIYRWYLTIYALLQHAITDCILNPFFRNTTNHLLKLWYQVFIVEECFEWRTAGNELISLYRW